MLRSAVHGLVAESAGRRGYERKIVRKRAFVASLWPLLALFDITACRGANPPEAAGFGHGNDTVLRVERGDKSLWTAVCSSDLVAAFIKSGVIVCRDCGPNDNVLIARNQSGKVVWRYDSGKAFAASSFKAGGNVLLVLGREAFPPSLGRANSVRDLLDLQDRLWVQAVDTGSGQLLWDGTESEVGHPVWTNGLVVLTVRVVPIRRHRSGHVRILLEERRARDCRLLWSKQLSGMPGDSVRVRSRVGSPARIDVRFSGNEGVHDMGYPAVPEFAGAVAAPLLGGKVPTGDDRVVIHAQKFDRSVTINLRPHDAAITSSPNK